MSADSGGNGRRASTRGLSKALRATLKASGVSATTNAHAALCVRLAALIDDEDDAPRVAQLTRGFLAAYAALEREGVAVDADAWEQLSMLSTPVRDTAPL